MDTEKINSRQDFCQFLEELRRDLIENPENWENVQLERYLEAMHAFVKDAKMFPEKTDWKTFAAIMEAASVYE